MREALEHHAFALLWPRRTLEFHAAIEARHEALLSAVDRGGTLAQIEAEMQFHCCPYEPADNLLLLGIRDQISARTRLVFTIHHQAFQQGASYRAAHQRYLDLALGDGV